MVNIVIYQSNYHDISYPTQVQATAKRIGHPELKSPPSFPRTIKGEGRKVSVHSEKKSLFTMNEFPLFVYMYLRLLLLRMMVMY